MKWLSPLLVTLTLVAVLGLPGLTRACPSCQDAIAAGSGDEDDDPTREPRAYNQSIYLMVTMPYLLLGSFGFLVYRARRQKTRESP